MNLNWQPAQARRALLVAHRGASDMAPENTLAAIDAALRVNVDAIEVDVQRTSDDVLVLVHDDNWKRTTGVDADVRELGWDDVRTLDAGSWFDDTLRDVRPPRLDDVLEHVKGRSPLDLEIKSPGRDAGLAAAVVDSVRRHGMQGEVLLTSFDFDCIDALSHEVDDIALGYISEKTVMRFNPDVAVHAYKASLLLDDPRAAQRSLRRGCRVLVWTVDEESDMQRLLEAGVDGIVTNRPAHLAAALEVPDRA